MGRGSGVGLLCSGSVYLTPGVIFLNLRILVLPEYTPGEVDF